MYMYIFEICLHVYLYVSRIYPSVRRGLRKRNAQWGSEFSLCTILPLPVLYGVYSNNGGSRGNIILRNSVGDDGAGWGA